MNDLASPATACILEARHLAFLRGVVRKRHGVGAFRHVGATDFTIAVIHALGIAGDTKARVHDLERLLADPRPENAPCFAPRCVRRACSYQRGARQQMTLLPNAQYAHQNRQNLVQILRVPVQGDITLDTLFRPV